MEPEDESRDEEVSNEWKAEGKRLDATDEDQGFLNNSGLDKEDRAEEVSQNPLDFGYAELVTQSLTNTTTDRLSVIEEVSEEEKGAADGYTSEEGGEFEVEEEDRLLEESE